MTTTSQKLVLRVGAMDRVETELRDFVARQTASATRYGEHYERLWQLTAHTMVGGKMVRPRLVVDAMEALRGEGTLATVREDTVVRAAVAVELLHYAFVLHDDVIDGDTMRRGRPNLVSAIAAEHPQHRRGEPLPPAGAGGKDPAMHWGNTAAILMGDLFLSGVYQTLARLDVTAAVRERLFAIVDQTIGETVAGEYVDVGLADGAIAPELTTILEMSAHKTAAYSFEFPLRVAAALAGASPSTEDALAAVGRHVGLAFQLQDDLLSVFGDPARHGKDPHSDLREGKETALIAYARMTTAWAAIEPHLGRADLSDRDAMAVRALLEQCGARRFVEGLIHDSLEEFRSGCRDPRLVSPRMAGVLLAVADRLEERES